MRSHLTRRIFRQLLSNRPLNLHRNEYTQYRHNRWQLQASNGGPVVLYRGFLWMSPEKSPRKAKKPQLEPGLAQLRQLDESLRLAHRPPSDHIVIGALKEYFNSKMTNKSSISDTQMEIVFTAVKHILTRREEIDTQRLTDEDLRIFLQGFQRVSKAEVEQIGAMTVDLIYTELQIRGYDPTNWDPHHDSHVKHEPLYHYLVTLRRYGQDRRIETILKEGLSTGAQIFQYKDLWMEGLRAFIQKDNCDGLMRMIERLEQHNIHISEPAINTLLDTAADDERLGIAKKLLTTYMRDHYALSTRTCTALLELSMKASDLDLGQVIINRILEQNDLRKDKCELVLQWTLFKKQNVESVERTMVIMSSHLSDLGQKTFDSVTIGKLLKTAYLMGSPSTAGGILSLASRNAIRPDGDTHMLQMEYHLGIGDIPGAQKAFKEAQVYEVPRETEVKLLNILIEKLCATRSPNHSLIMDYAQEITLRKAQFTPSAISCLVKLHLERRELLDAADLLQTHVHSYDRGDKAIVQDMLIGFVFDRRNDNTRAWDAYSLLREVFPETGLHVRTRMMTEFFDRGRSDMGLHAFGHMRQAQIHTERPTLDTYVRCFEGLASFNEPESVQLVHNMLKIDCEIEPDTRLRNSLMLAYLACQNKNRALEFWDDISHSHEGPTYNSIRIAFRICESSPGGDQTADEIWKRLQRFEVETTPEIFAAYVGALAGQGMMEEAIEAVSNTSKIIHKEPDTLIIGTLYNATRSDAQRKRLDEWIKTTYPAVWDALDVLGRDENDIFKIDRTLSA